ncbi:hypothetical protein M422DRAFT_32346 [Sphaerobolus stellatus SS14]|uniref:Uncharacterized protein n=1 Tax=Sphaerobolus stellatus (strain SS14) TaxID=990650 RepID=A0A0C9VQX6_SPHS4|nr:hypothetical protein M422DRAFT_32346 [Sphaerobolus stellatus SS14]
MVTTAINAQVEFTLVIRPGSLVLTFNRPAFDFARIMVQGWLQFLAILIICYFFVNIARWNRPLDGKQHFQFTTFKASKSAVEPSTAHSSTQDLVHNWKHPFQHDGPNKFY